MKLLIHVNSFEKSSVKLWPFCPGRDELKHVLLYLFEYFALSSASFTLVQLTCSNWVSGSVPLRRGRDNAVAVQWRWPAALAPRSCSQESGSNALVGRLCRGPARSAGFWIGFAWYHETPFLPTNAAGRAVAHSSVSAMVTLMTFIYFKWIVYISHNFVWIHNVVKQNSRCASVCFDLKCWNTFWYSALLYLL